MQATDQVIATTYQYKKVQTVGASAGGLELIMHHIPTTEFRTYVFFNEAQESKPAALQKFVHPKSSKNSMIKCIWSPQLIILEKSTNNYNFYDSKVNIEEKVVTFEGAAHLAKTQQHIVSNEVQNEISGAIKQISEHLDKTLNLKLLGGSFYFKIDNCDNLVLLFATQIKVDKVEVHTTDNMDVTLKLRMPSSSRSNAQRSQQQHLPAATSMQNRSRPMSSNQLNRHGIKTNDCPFCNQFLSQDQYEFTFHQILKLIAFFEDNSELLLNISHSPEQYNFNKKLHLSISVSKSTVPELILKLFPSMTVDKYQQKKSEPLFLYESIKVCEECYQHVKILIEHVNSGEKDKMGAKPYTSKNEKRTINGARPPTAGLRGSKSTRRFCGGGTPPNLKIAKSEKEERGPLSFHTSVQSHLTQDIKSVLQSATDNRSDAQRVQEHSSLQQKAMYDISSQNQDQLLSEQSGVDSDYDNVYLEIKTRLAPKEVKQHGVKGFVMFGKIEAGKEVVTPSTLYKGTQNNIMPLAPPTPFETQTLSEKFIDSDRVQIVSPVRDDFSYVVNQQRKGLQAKIGHVKVQNINKLLHSKTQNNQKQQILPVINWEKEYKKSVKEKSKQMAGDIKDAINKIENSQLEILRQDLEDLGGLKQNFHSKITATLAFPPDNMITLSQPQTSLKLFQSRTAAPHTFNCQYLESVENDCQQIIPKTYLSKQRTRQECTSTSGPPTTYSTIKKEGQSFQSSGRSNYTTTATLNKQKQYYGSANNTASGRLMSQTSSSARKNVKIEQYKIYEAQDGIIAQQNRFNYQTKENISAHKNIEYSSQQQQQLTTNYQVKKMRPMSSKPPTSTSGRHLMTQSNSTRQIKKRQHQINQVAPTASNQTHQNHLGGLFDFQNMTEGDIHQIAQNADTLIDIINNIKGSLDEKPIILAKDLISDTNINSQPLYEEDCEEDQTLEDEQQNGEWW